MLGPDLFGVIQSRFDTSPRAAVGALAPVLPRVAGAVRSAYQSGVLHMTAALLAAQGASYLTQLVVARVAPPAVFAVVRSVEAVLSVALVVASAGAPLIALRGAAVLRGAGDRARMLAALLRVVVGASLAAATCLAVAAPLVGGGVAAPLRATAWVLALTACSRTCLNFAQGIGQVRRVAAWTVLLSLAGATVVVVGMRLGGLEGWVAGRYLGEAGMLACLLYGLRGQYAWTGDPPAGYGWRQTVVSGAGIATSLLLRSAQDNMPVVMLNLGRVAAAQIGLFGLLHAVVLGFQIVPAALSSVLLPRLAAAVDAPGAAARVARRAGGWSMLVVGTMAAVVLVAGPPLVRSIWPAYSGALPLLPVLLAAVPLRMVTSLGGIVLVAYNDVPATVRINAAAAVASAVAYATLIPRMGITGAAWGFLCGEAVGAAVYASAAARHLGRTPRPVPPVLPTPATP